MILCVQAPVSRTLFWGAVRSVGGSANNIGAASMLGSYTICSSQFESRTRSNERSCKGREIDESAWARSYNHNRQ